jgi:hypothetical protein
MPISISSTAACFYGLCCCLFALVVIFLLICKMLVGNME